MNKTMKTDGKPAPGKPQEKASHHQERRDGRAPATYSSMSVLASSFAYRFGGGR